MRQWLLVGLVLCSLGCERNLGSLDAPQKFTREVHDQFDEQIEAVRSDPQKSEAEKEAEISRIQKERASFDAYNGGGQ